MVLELRVAGADQSNGWLGRLREFGLDHESVIELETHLKILHTDSWRRDAVALGLLCLLVLCGFWAAIPSQWQANQNYDYFCCYEPVARNFIAGNGWVSKPGVFGGWYAPGFSSVLAVTFFFGGLIGNELLALRVMIAVCMLATVLLVYALGRAVGGFWLGRAAAVCALGYPFLLWLTKQPNSETPFVPLLLATVYCYVRMLRAGLHQNESNTLLRWALWCGTFAGLAALTRPIAILSGVVLGACAWFILREQVSLRKRTLMLAALAAINFAVLLPWEITLHNHVGTWPFLASNGGVSIQDGMLFGLKEPPDRNGAPVPADVLEFMHRAGKQRDQLLSFGGAGKFLKAEFADHPVTVVKFILVKAARSWFGTHEAYQEGRTAAIQGLILLLAVFGLRLLRDRHSGGISLGLGTLTLYFWGMSLLVLPILRYMVPMTVVLMVGVGATVLAVVERIGLLQTTAVEPEPQKARAATAAGA